MCDKLKTSITSTNNRKKTLPVSGGFIYLSAKVHLLSSPEVGVRSRNCVRSLFATLCSTQVYCAAISAFLSILEDETILANTFFLYQVIDHSIHSVPAELLFLFC